MTSPNPPTPRAYYEERLVHFRTLEADWDSYGGRPLDPAVLEAVRIFMQAAMEGKMNLTPLSEGGVQLSVYWQGFDLVIEFESRKEGEAYGQVDGIWQRSGSPRDLP